VYTGGAERRGRGRRRAACGRWRCSWESRAAYYAGDLAELVAEGLLPSGREYGVGWEWLRGGLGLLDFVVGRWG